MSHEHFSVYYPTKSELEFFEREIVPKDIDDPFAYDGPFPSWASHTAVDYNGDLCAYSQEPVPTMDRCWTVPHPESGYIERILKGTEYCEDWLDSLRSI